MNKSDLFNGTMYIDYKVTQVIYKIDDFLKAYKKRYNRQYVGPREKIYMVHQEMPEGVTPVSIYIGKTKQPILQRLSQHTKEVIKARSGEKDWTIKLVWMNRVLLNGFALSIRQLNDVPKPMIYQIEEEWMLYLGMRGFNIMNTNNKKYWNGRGSTNTSGYL